ncbi:hypothetical protein KIL84_010810 [Mauremys mutica]|uniref:Uncharacterized protein n=1 Tax=Mauremys mutica TaxID=74926 RepID=A0A9D3XCA3_9SAUR|nr:hypothetical protein KIL84_010810 [Mauremys mutica]
MAGVRRPHLSSAAHNKSACICRVKLSFQKKSYLNKHLNCTPHAQIRKRRFSILNLHSKNVLEKTVESNNEIKDCYLVNYLLILTQSSSSSTCRFVSFFHSQVEIYITWPGVMQQSICTPHSL